MLLYLAAWIPVAVVLAAVVTRGGMSVLEAAVIVVPMCLLYAFICQASWYLCQALPLRQSETLRLLGTHATAGVVASAAWLCIGLVWAFLVGTSFELDGIVDRYLVQLPILLLAVVL